MKNYNGTELIAELCAINGPSGFEYKVAEFIKEQTEGLCEYIPDRTGNLICVVRGGGEGYNKENQIYSLMFLILKILNRYLFVETLIF